MGMFGFGGGGISGTFGSGIVGPGGSGISGPGGVGFGFGDMMRSLVDKRTDSRTNRSSSTSLSYPCWGSITDGSLYFID